MKLRIAKGYCSRLLGVMFDRSPGRRRLELGWGRKVRLVFEWR